MADLQIHNGLEAGRLAGLLLFRFGSWNIGLSIGESDDIDLRLFNRDILNVDQMHDPGEQAEMDFEQRNLCERLSSGWFGSMEDEVPDAQGQMAQIELERADLDFASSGFFKRCHYLASYEIGEP